MNYTDYIDALTKYEKEFAKYISEYKVYKAKCDEYANFLNSKYSDFINKHVRITYGGNSLSCFFKGFKLDEGMIGTINTPWVRMDICAKKKNGWCYCVQLNPPSAEYFDNLVFEEI